MRKEIKNSGGITLISLVLTIVVCAILSGISIYYVVREKGILDEVKNARNETLKSQASEELDIVLVKVISKINKEGLKNYEICTELEKQLGKYDTESTAEIDETGFLVIHRGFYFQLDEYCDRIEGENSSEDMIVARESVFIWSDEEPNTVVGYRPAIREYTTLIFPNRCTSIQYPSESVDSTVGSSSGTSIIVSGTTTTSSGTTTTSSGITTTSSGTGSSEEKITYFDYIQEIRIPKTVESIGISAFARVFKNLEKVLIVGETTIGKTAFAYCTNLKEISMPKVTEIGYGAFSGCSSLTEVDLVNVEIIGAFAFENCTSLNCIILSDTVQSISGKAFNNISSTAVFYVVQDSYADTWLKNNKVSTQTIVYK